MRNIPLLGRVNKEPRQSTKEVVLPGEQILFVLFIPYIFHYQYQWLGKLHIPLSTSSTLLFSSLFPRLFAWLRWLLALGVLAETRDVPQHSAPLDACDTCESEGNLLLQSQAALTNSSVSGSKQIWSTFESTTSIKYS